MYPLNNWLTKAGISILAMVVLQAVGSADQFLEDHRYRAGVANQGVAVADFNGDGKLDLAVASSGRHRVLGFVTVLLGNGDGTFQAPVRYASGYHAVAVAVADFNRDGKPDIAFTASKGLSGNVGILLNNGDGTFPPPIIYPGGKVPYALVAGDFNGDGVPDLAVGITGTGFTGTPNDNGRVDILLGKGDGTFLKPIHGPTPGPLLIATGDFNGDHNLDLVVSSINAGTEVSIALGTGDGTFQPFENVAFTSFPLGIVAADVNQDGKLDVVSVNNGTFDVSVFLGAGDGTFHDGGRYYAGIAALYAAAGDFDADGKPDLAVATCGRKVNLLLGNGDGSFRQAEQHLVGIDPRGIATGDFLGRGALDLVLPNFGPSRGSRIGTVSVLINTLGAAHAVPKTMPQINPAEAPTKEYEAPTGPCFFDNIFFAVRGGTKPTSSAPSAHRSP